MRMTKQRLEIMADLEGGAYFMVTKSNQDHINDHITLEGATRRGVNDSVITGLFWALKGEGRLVAADDGLFPGCGQSFKLVR